MENKVKNGVFNTILVAVCSFVGVGFVTGAEIWFYFARFEVNAIFGLISFFVLSFLLFYFSLSEKETENNENKFKIKTYFAGVSELFVASAMIAGLMETSRLLFGKIWFIVFLCSVAVCFCVFWRGMKSVVFYNYFVAVFVVFVIISLFIFNNNKTIEIKPKILPKSASLSFVFGAIYIFMNIAEIRPILQEFGKENHTKTSKTILSLCLSLLLIFLIVTISFMILKNKNLVCFSMPFLVLFKLNGGVVFWLFLIGLVMCLISTAVSCLIGVKNKCNFSKNDEKFAKLFVMILSLILGQIPFPIFIKIIYPVVAILNFLIFVFELIYRKNNKKIENKI